MTKRGDRRAEERRTRALAALEEIRRAFAASGVTEVELQAEGRRIRAQLSRERYGLDSCTESQRTQLNS